MFAGYGNFFKAIEVINKWVCPYLPKNKKFRPQIIFPVKVAIWTGNLIYFYLPDDYLLPYYGEPVLDIPIWNIETLKTVDGPE